MTYLELENLRKKINKEVCLFGAGIIGKSWGYDLISAAGFDVDFYCDNSINIGTVIRDGAKVQDVQYLYKNKDRVQVFLTVGPRYQQVIIEQLQKHGVNDVIVIDQMLLSSILESIENSNQEAVKKRYFAVYNDVEYLERKYEQRTGNRLDIKNPRTFNEKLQWLKIYNPNSQYIEMVDKYRLKQFVEKRIGKGYTIPALGLWDNFDDIDFNMLPESFVLKCTHDSGSIVIVNGRSNFDKKEAKKKLEKALHINYFWLGREWPYKYVKPRIMAEEYLCDASAIELKDYKLFCFNGEVKLIQVDFDRFVDHKRNIYNTKWEYIPLMIEFQTKPERVIRKPKCLKEMIEIAEKLSTGIPHVRVDFYVVDDKPLVGEMTFFHGGGMEKFVPSKWDKIMGSWIDLSLVNES